MDSSLVGYYIDSAPGDTAKDVERRAKGMKDFVAAGLSLKEAAQAVGLIVRAIPQSDDLESR